MSGLACFLVRSGSACRDATTPAYLPPRNHSMCAATRVFVERNPAVVLWLPRRHSSPSTLAKTVTKKACGTGSADGCDKSGACLAQGVDDQVSLRHFRSMWQGHISEHG